MSVRIERDPQTGLQAAVVTDAREWEREARFTQCEDGSIQVTILVLRDGIFETSETYRIAREDVPTLGAAILSGSRRADAEKG